MVKIALVIHNLFAQDISLIIAQRVCPASVVANAAKIVSHTVVPQCLLLLLLASAAHYQALYRILTYHLYLEV
jgi:hypothetical protein